MIRTTVQSILSEFSIEMEFEAPLELDENGELVFTFDDELEVGLSTIDQDGVAGIAFSAHIECAEGIALEAQNAVHLANSTFVQRAFPPMAGLQDDGRAIGIGAFLTLEELTAESFKAALEGVIEMGFHLLERIDVDDGSRVNKRDSVAEVDETWLRL